MHHAIAKRPLHGPHAERQRQGDAAIAQGEEGPSCHLPGLNPRLTVRIGLLLQQKRQHPDQSHRSQRGEAVEPALLPDTFFQLHIRHGTDHAHGIHVQKSGQLVDHKVIIRQGIQLKRPIPQPREDHCADGQRGPLVSRPCDPRENEVELHFQRNGPTGHAQRRAEVSIHVLIL